MVARRVWGLKVRWGRATRWNIVMAWTYWRMSCNGGVERSGGSGEAHGGVSRRVGV